MGWPQILRLRTIAPLPPVDLRLPWTRSPRRHAPCDPEGSPEHVPAGRRCRRLPVDPVRPDAFAVACSGRRLPVAPGLPRTRSEMAGEHCPAPIPLCVVNDVGWTSTSRSPLLVAPVRMRCSERCSVNTSQNPRSSGIFKITGLSPKLSRYPQELCRHPRDAHRSCTGNLTARIPTAGSTLIPGPDMC